MTYFCRDYYHNKLSTSVAFTNAGWQTIIETTLPEGTWIINASMTARPTSLSFVTPYIAFALVVGGIFMVSKNGLIENVSNIEECVNLNLMYVATLNAPATISVKAINGINELTYALANGTWLTARRLDEPKAGV